MGRGIFREAAVLASARLIHGGSMIGTRPRIGLVLLLAVTLHFNSAVAGVATRGESNCRVRDEAKLTNEYGLYVTASQDQLLLHNISRRSDAGKYLADQLLLVSAPDQQHCGFIEDAIDLLPGRIDGESIEFKCHTGQSDSVNFQWGVVVGLASNNSGKTRRVRPRAAWRIDLKKLRFERLDGSKVTCDTTGLIVNDTIPNEEHQFFGFAPGIRHRGSH